MIFHLSKRKLTYNKLFPRIPCSATLDEDKNLKRICFAKTIEGCLNALPGMSDNILKCHLENNVPELFYVYKTDEKDIFKNNYMDTEYVSKFVHDAKDTGEVWVTEDTEVDYMYTIKLKANINGIIIGYDKSIEDYNRNKKYRFKTESELENFLLYVDDGYDNIDIIKNKEMNEIRLTVPAKKDMSILWEKYREIKKQYYQDMILLRNILSDGEDVLNVDVRDFGEDYDDFDCSVYYSNHFEERKKEIYTYLQSMAKNIEKLLPDTNCDCKYDEENNYFLIQTNPSIISNINNSKNNVYKDTLELCLKKAYSKGITNFQIV